MFVLFPLDPAADLQQSICGAGTSEQYSGAGEPMPAHKNARDAATPSKNRQASRGSSRQDRRETCGLGETSPPPSPGQKSRGVRKEAVPTTAWTASPGTINLRTIMKQIISAFEI